LFDGSINIRPNCRAPAHFGEAPNSLPLELAQPFFEQYLTFTTHIMAAKKDVPSVRENYVPPRSTVRTHRVFVAPKSKIKHQSLFDVLCAWIMEHQVGVCWHVIFV